MSRLALADSFEYLCYGSTAIRYCFYSYSAGIDFSRQNVMSTDVRFWRLKSIPALQGLNIRVNVCHLTWPTLSGYKHCVIQSERLSHHHPIRETVTSLPNQRDCHITIQSERRAVTISLSDINGVDLSLDQVNHFVINNALICDPGQRCEAL